MNGNPPQSYNPLVADFEEWFSFSFVRSAYEEPEKQKLKLGLLFEVFRRRPEVLRWKLEEHFRSSGRPVPESLTAVATSSTSDNWICDPWNIVALRNWEQPWSKVPKEEQTKLAQMTQFGAVGPKGISMQVDALVPDTEQESEVCKYIFPKPPMFIENEDGAKREVRRILIEPEAERLEKGGWKLFLIDVRSKKRVERACDWIKKYHTRNEFPRGRWRPEGCAEFLRSWNRQFVRNDGLVEISLKAFNEMDREWSKLKLGKFVPEDC